MNFQKIASVTREFRNKLDISQIDLARKLGYLNGQFISNVERGLCGMPLKMLPKFCEITGAPKEVVIKAMMDDYEQDLRKALYREESIDAAHRYEFDTTKAPVVTSNND